MILRRSAVVCVLLMVMMAVNGTHVFAVTKEKAEKLIAAFEKTDRAKYNKMVYKDNHLFEVPKDWPITEREWGTVGPEYVADYAASRIPEMQMEVSELRDQIAGFEDRLQKLEEGSSGPRRLRGTEIVNEDTERLRVRLQQLEQRIEAIEVEQEIVPIIPETIEEDDFNEKLGSLYS